MNPRVLLTSIALAATAAFTGGIVLLTNEPAVTTQERLRVAEPSKLARLPDGGRGYLIRIRLPDGGAELRTTAPDCARRNANDDENARILEVP